MQATDAELVTRAAAGDREAFAALIARHQTLVCSVALGVVGDLALSEDVGQETFVAAWQQLAELRQRENFKTWVCAIARNLARNAVRRERRFPPHDRLAEGASLDEDPADQVADREEREIVWRSLEELPPRYREPLVLYYRQDQSITEVAEALNVSTDVVKQRLSRGRNLLRAEVAAVVERTLRRTTPSRAFTVAVVAALPAVTSPSAAATVATTAAAPAVIGSISVVGVLGAVFGTLFGLGGAALGTWRSWATAEYQSQRDLIVRQVAIYSVGMALFMAPIVAMVCGWQPWVALGPRGYTIVYGIWMSVFMTANMLWIFGGIRQWNALTAREQARGAARLPGSLRNSSGADL